MNLIAEYEPIAWPYDVEATRWTMACGQFLAEAGLHPFFRRHNRTLKFTIGSGPGGRERFGDRLMPPIVQLLVPEEEEEAARCLMIEHNEGQRLMIKETHT